MNALQTLLRTLHDGERLLERDLLSAAQRHRGEQELRRVAADMAGWSREHAERIARTAEPYGLRLPDLAGPFSVLSVSSHAAVGEHVSPALGPPPASSRLLLRDLRDLHLAAATNSSHWEMLARAAHACRHADLITLATACQPETVRQLRWTTTMIRTFSPQPLISS
ncbi:hypothetical protein [Streptomyces mangrovisoli]|uniref:Uncharacterized protein n=1 Tax=Streptomyces mangrovisoli TaxID=1428628 RepID=A0A1J4P2F1_9ACTN|nr:hypothetical protein [Streptomyces mangrovisoli]OIJ68378.1 hypothetical protein WN71_008120 [Streptomyces mangrovisoli]